MVIVCDMKKISLFDLDHTLLKGNSSYFLGKTLYQKGYFSLYKLILLLSCYFFHKLGFVSLKKLHQFIFFRIFFGKSSHELDLIVAEFVEAHVHQLVYMPAFEKLNFAKKEGHFTAILSNSPDFLVKAIANYFKVDDFRATVYGLDDKNRFCQISSHFEGEDKADYLISKMKQMEVSNRDVFAYSDSILDLVFLKASGVPFAVNPDSKLKNFASKNRWNII